MKNNSLLKWFFKISLEPKNLFKTTLVLSLLVAGMYGLIHRDSTTLIVSSTLVMLSYVCIVFIEARAYKLAIDVLIKKGYEFDVAVKIYKNNHTRV